MGLSISSYLWTTAKNVPAITNSSDEETPTTPTPTTTTTIINRYAPTPQPHGRSDSIWKTLMTSRIENAVDEFMIEDVVTRERVLVSVNMIDTAHMKLGAVCATYFVPVVHPGCRVLEVKNDRGELLSPLTPWFEVLKFIPRPPNVVRVLTVDPLDMGLPMYTPEYLEKAALDEVRREIDAVFRTQSVDGYIRCVVVTYADVLYGRVIDGGNNNNNNNYGRKFSKPGVCIVAKKGSRISESTIWRTALQQNLNNSRVRGRVHLDIREIEIE